MSVRIRLFIILLVSLWEPNQIGSRLMAQEAMRPNASILESRISTPTVIEGDPFSYFLKFDYAEGAPVIPIQHFEVQGWTILETRALDPQVFAGRVIQQFEYTVQAPVGAYDFSPVTLQYPGPLVNPVVVAADPLQVTVVPALEARIESNSPIMLHEPLTVNVVLTQHQPVTITALPHELQADYHAAIAPEPAETESSATTTPAPPSPPALQFKLDDAPEIHTAEVDGQMITTYTFETLVEPVQPGVYVIPPFAVAYRTAQGEERQTLTPDDTKIFVLHPNTGNLAVKTDYRFLIVPASVLGALVLAGIGGLLLWRARQQRLAAAATVAPPLPPDAVARKELAAIRDMRLPARGEFKQYYSLVSEAVRKFLGAEFGFHVLERTTEEVMRAIRQGDVPQAIVDETGRFLREADLVKFAKYIPLLAEADAAMQHALNLVEESVEYHQRRCEQAVSEMPDEQIGDLKPEAL